MSVLRYASQEAANIKKAESRATQQARLNASLAVRKSASDLEAASASILAGTLSIAPPPLAYDSTGSANQIACDGTYLYFCYDTDQWGRVPFDATPW